MGVLSWAGLAVTEKTGMFKGDQAKYMELDNFRYGILPLELL